MNIQLFMSVFKGRHDIYAKRWEKDGKNGYSPAYQVDWSKFSAFKARGGKFADYPYKTPLPLTLEIIKNNGLFDHFASRCKKIVDDTSDMGWGFHDNLEYLFENYYKNKRT